MRLGVPFLVASVFVVAGLAGCIGDEPPAPPADPSVPGDPKVVRSADGRDLRADLQKEDELPAPTWQVGESFGIHIFFGPGDAEGFHMNAIVTEDRGASWFIAPDASGPAKDEAVFDLPVFGEIKKDHLTTTGFGNEWKLFDFPLSDGKTWSGRFTVPSFSSFDQTTYELDFLVSYDAAISTPEGDRPGYKVMGHTKEGQMVMEYSYTPSIGWLAHFWLYDMSTPDESDYLFHMMNMGHGYNWTGTYYVTEATNVADIASHVIVNPEDPTNHFVDPKPHAKFTMTDTHTHLYGFVYAFAFGGATHVVLVDPTGDRHEAPAGLMRQGADPQGFDMQFRFIDVPSVAGEWNAALVTAGVVSGAGLYLFALTEEARNL